MINDYLKNYIGFTYNQKLVMDAHKAILENKKKIAPGSIAEACSVIVHDKGEIKSIGAGIPTDLINDNYGLMIKRMMSFLSAGQITDSLFLDTSNINRTVKTSHGLVGGNQNAFMGGVGAASVGFRLQVGQGSTAPTRSEFNIETPFGTAPENTTFNSLAGLYNPGLGTFTYGNSIIAGGSGTITEVVTISVWLDNPGTQRAFLLARDLISPGVAFLAAQNIAVNWTWTI